jgi:putative hydrolase of the HAD superfamily
MPPTFFYFDMGNVLLHFDHRRAARQMAEVAGTTPERVWEVVFGGDLELRYEAGEVSTREFYDIFSKRTETRADFDRLAYAASAIFEENIPMKRVVALLQGAGYFTGVLSNTNEIHWRYVSDGRYGLFPRSFDAIALSYEIGANKPDERMYQRAAELAGVAPGEILYVDDRPENVDGALRAGFDAVLYVTAAGYVRELFERGVRIAA